MLSDIKIAQSATILPVRSVARKLKIPQKYLIPYGEHIAKIDLDILQNLSSSRGKYIFVTAITPTPLGEGKTVNTIGLSMALNRIGKLTSCCIRQPSLGPVFGIKGGAAGGGYSQVLPMESFNLHFTGDVHAIGLAHNLAAAFLDNSVFKGNPLNIDPQTISWRRVIEVSDRFLRKVRIGLGGEESGIPRDTGFDITAASEIMAIFALSTSIADMRRRLGRIVLAFDRKGRPVTAEDLKVAGSMAVLLKDALKPNLIQTIEHTPCFVHTGPFGNIAHGNSSIIQDKIALSVSEFVVTESGFGADCGAEKFFDIKCRTGRLCPDAAVMVCSVRGLKAHSGIFRVIPGKPLDSSLTKENIPALEEGLCNLKKQIENVSFFGVPVVVAINRFDTDSPAEISLVRRRAMEFGAFAAEVSEVWRRGSAGGVELAKSVVRASNAPKKIRYLYPLSMPVAEKIRRIATVMYGAKGIEFSPLAAAKVKKYTRLGWGKLPVCMAKTHLSLSHDPKLRGCPQGFILPVRDINASIGAGFLYAVCGRIQTMPGLPTHPAGEKIDLDPKGKICGLS